MESTGEIRYTWTKKKRIDLFKMTVAVITLIVSVIILSGMVADTEFSREILIVCFSGTFLLTVLILMSRGKAVYELIFDGVHLIYRVTDSTIGSKTILSLDQIKYEPFIQSMNIQCAIPYRTLEAIEWKKKNALIRVEAKHHRLMEIEVEALEIPLQEELFSNIKNLIQ